MCGIAGVTGLEPDVAAPVVRRMLAVLTHRGPDDEGLAAGPLATAGVRRLSIIDLDGGRQPVWNEARTVAVVLNGEIYNFEELRRELVAHGHLFRSRADTEVVAHGYEEWGRDVLARLRGMFALAILDLRASAPGQAALWLARDPFGIKPLYYAFDRDALVFASEVRALLASGRVPRTLSLGGLHSYLLFGSVAEPTTLLEGVRSLPPGYALLWRPGARPAETGPETFWTFPTPPPAPRSRADAAPRLRALLEETVELHLVADVPLGIFLSSGIDSTAMAALAARRRPGVNTVTVVFPESEFSEAPDSRRVAQRLGTDHREVRLAGEDLLAQLDAAVAAFDLPSMDGLNTYFVSGAARQAGLKVALSGLGGDELFGGYPTFRSTPSLARLAALARLVPGGLRELTAAAVARAGAWFASADAGGKLAAAWRDPDALPHPYFYSRLLFTPRRVSELTRDSTLDGRGADWGRALAAAALAATAFDEMGCVSSLELRSYLLNTLLRDTDTMSMANSLEVRLPFLDHRLVEFVLGLPESRKRGAQPKALLVEALGELLPPEVARRPKRTFTFPWERWLRGPLGKRVAASLAELAPSLRPALDPRAVEQVWTDFLARRTTWSRPWSLFVLNEWARRHLDGATARTSAAPSVSHPEGLGETRVLSRRRRISPTSHGRGGAPGA